MAVVKFHNKHVDRAFVTIKLVQVQGRGCDICFYDIVACFADEKFSPIHCLLSVYC